MVPQQLLLVIVVFILFKGDGIMSTINKNSYGGLRNELFRLRCLLPHIDPEDIEKINQIKSEIKKVKNSTSEYIVSKNEANKEKGRAI